MKRYVNTLLALAILGAAVAGLLTYLHYYPDAGMARLCGGTGPDGCDALLQSGYAALLGIPTAAYGLFFYLVILFTLLIADYADGCYYRMAFMVLLPLVGLSLLASSWLAAVMFSVKAVCLLCAATYLINILLMLTLLFWYRYLKETEGYSWREAFRMLIPQEEDAPAKKAAAALYMLFVFLLLFAVFSTSYILTMKTASPKTSREQVVRAVEMFFGQPAENPVLPESRLMLGKRDAKVQIVAFTDFLCSACYQLFQSEKYLYAKYGDKISFVYYNYPLDQTCNDSMQRTLYPLSCTASRAVLAAASVNILEDYLTKHYSRYQEFHEGYTRDKAVDVIAGLADSARFQMEMDSPATSETIKRDIELAVKLKINATPTIFINGRRMDGAPPREILEAIIERELRSDKTTP